MIAIPILAQDTPHLFLNGELKDVKVIIKNSSTLVPLRFSSEELNADVKWDKLTQEITITKGSDTILFQLGSITYSHNGIIKELLIAPELIAGVTYVPFRSLVEALNGVVFYNNDHKFINIYDVNSKAYDVYNSLNSTDVTTKRFALLESPRLSRNTLVNPDVKYYIFPLESPSSDYFFEYQGDWKTNAIISLNRYSLVDGIAVNVWGRQINQETSFPDATHLLLKLIGDDLKKINMSLVFGQTLQI